MSVDTTQTDLGANMSEPLDEAKKVLANLNRIKGNLSDARSLETHEHELLEIDGKIDRLEKLIHTLDFAEKNAAQAELRLARSVRADITSLIEELIVNSDWCNCEWYDDVVVNPVLVSRVADWLDGHEYVKERCVRANWGIPERAVDDLRTLTRVRWRDWYAYLVSACMSADFRVVRKNGKVDYDLPFTRDELEGKSFTAIRVFERIRPFVFYDRVNGGLYYRASNEDGTVETRRILCREDEKRAVFSKFWNDPGICSHRGRATSHARFLVNFLGISRLDVELFIKETELYQISSKHKVIPKVVQPLVTSRPMEHLQADLVDMGAFKGFNNQGYRYILVMVDLFSKYVWARSLKTKEGAEVKEAIMGVLWNEGFPTIFQTDNGSEFFDIGKELQSRGIMVRRGRSYKPSSQGQVERTNRTLKQAFYMDFLASENYEWNKGLHEKVYAYNTMVHSAIRKTPYEIHRGVKPRNAPEFAESNATDLLRQYLDGVATTILGKSNLVDDRDLAREIMEDEKLLIEKWGEIPGNTALLPSLAVKTVGVAKATGEEYKTYQDAPKKRKRSMADKENYNLSNNARPRKKKAQAPLVPNLTNRRVLARL